jgi:hypothetical protein
LRVRFEQVLMAIYRLLQNSGFDPDAIKIMTVAFEGACRELQLADRSDPFTEMVAKKVIEIAQLGERDPVRICDRALRELGVSPA